MTSLKSVLVALFFICIVVATAHAQELSSFAIQPFDENQFTKFVKIFSDMRGPLRSEILKDHKTDFKDADPLKYVAKVKDEPKVLSALKDNNLTWDQFTSLMGNILLAYLNNQPQKTKVTILQQMSGYGLGLADDQIPEQFRDQFKALMASPSAAALAGIMLDQVVQIPAQNAAIAKTKNRTLDQLFYTRLWRGQLQ